MMRKSLAVVMTFVLMVVSILPGVRPVPLRVASAYAPPPPTLPTPASPSVEPEEGDESPYAPPSPDELAPEVEKARARQVIEGVLEKYLNYWGPRYRVAPVEVAVEGEWAYGVAEWRGTASTVDGPLHVLAHRSESGEWQALMPSSDGLYLQWVDEAPESLVLAGEKSQLRTQAAEADALRRPQATPTVPPTVMPLGKERQDESPETVPGLVLPTTTPTLLSQQIEELVYSYVCDGNIWITDKTGQFHRQLTSGNHDSKPALSPDGRLVAYLSVPPEYLGSAPTPQNICIVDRITQDSRCLTNEAAMRGTPVWSPDSTRIAYFENGHLIVINSDGSGKRVLADSATFDGMWQPTPAWSPDGTSIACMLRNADDVAIWLIDVDSAISQRITDDLVSVGSAYAFRPASNTLAFLNIADRSIWLTDLDRHRSEQLDRSVEDVYDFAWSSDGRKLIYSTLDSSLWLFDITSQTSERIQAFDPSWPLEVKSVLPDGDSIVLLTGQVSSPDYFMVSLSTGELTEGSVQQSIERSMLLEPSGMAPLSNISAPFEWYRYQGEPSSGAPGGNAYCGQTCVAMAIQFAHNNEWVAISDIVNYIGHGWTNTSDLLNALTNWNVDRTTISSGDMNAVRDAVNNRGHIVLVPIIRGDIPLGSDGNVPWSNPADYDNRYHSYADGHWVVVKGISDDQNWVIVYDPLAFDGNGLYWYSNGIAKGRERYYFYPRFTEAFANNGARAIEILEVPDGSDTTPPDGDITSPNENETITNRTAHLAGWASDSQSGFNHAHFTANFGSGWRSVGPDFTSSPFGFDWDMCNDGVPNGPVTLGLDIWDNAGNEANSPHGNRHFTKNYDCTPPPSCDATSLPSEYSKCAEEGEWCAFSGTQQVYYGANSCFKIKSFTNGVGCNNDNFGDPLPGVHKACYSPPQSPAAPSLQSPGNGSTFNEGESITLSWSDTGNEYYGEVWGGPGGTLTFGWQSGTSYNLGSQGAGYTYSWHVKARNSTEDQSDWSDTWTFTVKPAAPSNLSAQTASCSAVNLYWNDNSGNEEGYKIYRDGSNVSQVGMNTTSYQDTGLSENTNYSYYVKAYRGSIESNASNTVNITTPSCAPPQPDLMPSQWGGWQYPVVPSSITGTNQVNTLYAGYLTYIDWGLTNAGDASSGGNTYGDLYVDGTRIGHYDFGDVLAGQTWGFFDWGTIVDTPGWHTLKSVADPDNLIAESDETNNVFQRDFYWIASAPYADDMESGTNDWAAAGLWHQVDASSPYPESHSGSHSWWYGQDGTGDYDTGADNSGDLTSPLIYIPDSGYYLRFWYRYETETQGPSWDQRWLQISVDDGPFENVLQLYDDPTNWWLQSQAIDLSGYAGHTVQVRFYFDTLNNSFNDYRGWYIDDFEISTTPPPTCADFHEPDDTVGQATAIAYGQTLSADICPGGDYDFYTFTGAAGDKIVVDIDAEVNGSLLDSYVYLLGSDGTSALAENDDEITADVHDSHLGYQLPYTGTYYIKVKAWDHPSAGSSDHFYDIHLITDDGSPSAEITSPGHDSWLNPNLQIVTTDVSDSESGIRNVTFYWHDANWDGSSDWIVLEDDRDSRDGWTYELDTSSIPEQSRDCVVFIYAYDWAGNYIGYGSYHLGLDRTPPTVSAGVQPAYGDAPFRDFWVNWWNSYDNLSGIADYDVQYRDGVSGAWTNLAIGTTQIYTRFVGLNGHTYYFRARARDNAGNESAYAGGDGDAQHTVEICHTPPDAYEADDTSSNARWITPDAPMQIHNFHAEGDRDWGRFYAAAGITYTLATTNTGGHADTVLYLYDTDGTTLIASNDDYPGIWPASRIGWQPATGGFYWIKVEHWDPWAYGCTTEYGLSIVGSEPTPFSQVYLPLVLHNRRE